MSAVDAAVFGAFMNSGQICMSTDRPFGGVKNSGYGKFGGAAGIESFTEQRWVTIQHSGRPAYPF
jgi:acyl-CoA reductase-like NAD-dependent aldehyde dehydrogenase